MVQDLVFLFADFQDLQVDTSLQLVEASLDVCSITWCISHSSWFCMTCKLAEGAVCPIMQAITENILEHRQALGHSPGYCLPPELLAVL